MGTRSGDHREGSVAGRGLEAALILFLLTLFLSSCSREKNALRIGVCVADQEEGGLELMREEMEEAARKIGVKLIWRDTLRWRREGESSVMAERRIVRELLREGVKALVWKPPTDDLDKEFLVLRWARDKGVPVVALDRLPRRMKAALFVRPNYLGMGEMAARFALQRALRGRESANFIVLEEPPGDRNLREVVMGIYNVLDESPRVVVLARPRPKGMREAAGVVNALLTKYAGNVQAIVACRSDLAAGAVEALKAYRLEGKTVTVGVGAMRIGIERVLREEHDAEVDPMPGERAKLALEMAVELAKGEEVEPDDLIDNLGVKVPVKYGPARIITRRNVTLFFKIYPELWRGER